MKKLEKTIDKLLKEYTGTGAGGGNATDGNDIPSPRIGGSFENDKKELDDYTRKNVYGAEGNHYRKDADPFNYERTKMGMFEEELDEEAYDHATLTTQGQSISRAPGVWEEDEELEEQLSQGEMDSYNNKKTHHHHHPHEKVLTMYYQVLELVMKDYLQM